MSRFLTDALLKNRANLYDLRQVVKGQINQLKSSSQMVQNYVKDEADRLKTLFEPAIGAQVRKINEMKLEVSKITSEQLTTKKIILNLQASISHCETQIGFMEFHK